MLGIVDHTSLLKMREAEAGDCCDFKDMLVLRAYGGEKEGGWEEEREKGREEREKEREDKNKWEDIQKEGRKDFEQMGRWVSEASFLRSLVSLKTCQNLCLPADEVLGI